MESNRFNTPILATIEFTFQDSRYQEIQICGGRSAILDVHAFNIDNKEVDIEIQRLNAGAGAKRARYFKQGEKGVVAMCKIMEDIRNEKAKEVRVDNALRMIKEQL